MKSQQASHRSQKDRESLKSQREIYYILLGIGLFLLLRFLFFVTTSAELTCSRSPLNSIECSLVRNTPLRRMDPVKILDPLAVDVITHERKRNYSYTIEIRAAHAADRVVILSTYSYDFAQDSANKVNDFLLRSDAASFFGRFPEKAQGIANYSSLPGTGSGRL